MQRISLLLIFIITTISLVGQTKYTISGTITDATSGESLIGANVYVSPTDKGTISNNYGFYSITIQATDSIGVTFSYLGYDPQIKKVILNDDIRIDLEMAPTSSALEEVVVTAHKADENINKPQMGIIDIPTSKIKELPAVLGEVDVLKIIQLLPGVQSGNEGTTGFHVRGGNMDQNLIQLDEAVIYNPNHLVGLFSTFNARAINNVSLIKGGFPAQYGGRLSSIVDISMKEGNSKRLGVEGGIGLITSQLSIEGPIKKDKASFIISSRRSYFDWVIKPFLAKSIKTNYLFYDLNAKVNWQLGKNDRLFVSAFAGKDDATYSQDGIEYNVLLQNRTSTARWNHIFGSKLFLNTSFIINSYDQDISALQDNAFSQVVSGIDDVSGKMEFQFFPDASQVIKFGVHYSNHIFRSSGDSEVFAGTTRNPGIDADAIPKKSFDEFAFYINDEISFSNQASLILGIRVPGFYDKDVSYYEIEPRASIKFSIDSESSIKASYSLMNQFIHQIPSSTASIPTDIWIPSTQRTKPQLSQQYALGFFKNWDQNALESNVELYYKSMDNQVLFSEGNQLIKTLDVDDLLSYGKGWSYGAEFFVKKNVGRLSGWLAYTLSWTFQEFDDINLGRKFPFRHDRRHSLSVAATYELNDHWTFSGTFVYGTGSAYTVPVGRTYVNHGGSLFEGNYYIYDGRNNARLADFHRLNLSASHKKVKKIFGREYTRELVFSLYNTYNRQNPYFIYFDIEPHTEKPRAKQVSLLPVIPSFTYNFKF